MNLPRAGDNVCVFVAYSCGGPGHCDALIERRGEGMEEVRKTRSVESGDVCSKRPKCTRGIKNKELKPVCCNPESASRQYASRYPCLKLEQLCGVNCRCNGCQSPTDKKFAITTRSKEAPTRNGTKTIWEEIEKRAPVYDWLGWTNQWRQVDRRGNSYLSRACDGLTWVTRG